MYLEVKKQILEKIKEYDKILIFRHKRPDGDCTGSTKGFQRILQLTFPQKTILLQNCDFSDYVAFLGKEDEIIPEEEYKDALGIVIDTSVPDRVSNPNYSLCKELIKIDHHIPMGSYADIEWIEENRSSAAEMIAEFYDTFKDELKIDKEAATCIYCGMVTDSGRFQYREVDGTTMKLAGIMIDCGIDLDTLYAHLYLKDYNTLKFKAYVYKKMKQTQNGVVHILIDEKIRKKFKLTIEEASTCVGFLDSIKGALIWLAFIETKENIRVRLRSRFITVNEVAEQFGGGGHACASGATVKNRKEMQKLIDVADKTLEKYKNENEGWL